MAGLAGCGNGPEAATAGVVAVGSPGAVPATDIDAYIATDAAFFAQLGVGEGALLARPPATLRDATQESTAVVTARVGDVQPSRTVGGMALLGVELVDLTIVSGALEEPAAPSVIVEFVSLGPANVGEKAASMRAQRPQGMSLWFLRWHGTPPPSRKPDAPPWPAPESFDPRLYGLVHLYGVLIQGADRVQAPTADPRLEGFQKEAAGLSRLSEVITAVKGS